MKWTAITDHFAGIPWYRLLSNMDPTTQYNAILGKCLHVSLLFVPARKQRSESGIPRNRRVLMRKRERLKKRPKNGLLPAFIGEKIGALNLALRVSADRELADRERRADACIKFNPKYFFHVCYHQNKIRCSRRSIH